MSSGYINPSGNNSGLNQTVASSNISSDNQMEGVTSSDENTMMYQNQSQSSQQLNRYSIEHPQGRFIVLYKFIKIIN